ncbi:hypothetical protein POM88_019211 [Heracleum sosnowskyi]|uniref:F-box protein n=1 Tax=Heracleum sosnowskyi TaxID=360622 RepID=A0AAD8IU11_9APIA|nr:hypothetical protein POM88_019211 [Heracleum sosnowskyi]
MEETEGEQIICGKTDMNREVSWSELVADLLGDIIGRLCVSDRVRFRAVCKSWRDAKPIACTSTSKLPWWVTVGRTDQNPTTALECRLYDPSYSLVEHVSVHTISFTELCIPALRWNRIRTFCKQGWLFISISERTRSSDSRIYFMLFSPLTKKLMQLPSLTPSYCFIQTFSSNPESADCVFLLLDAGNSHDFTVTTCRKGDKQWTVRKFERLGGFECSRPMFIRGLFYIVSCYGQLASYNVIEEKLNYESLYRDQDIARYDPNSPYRVFMRNGELMYNYQCNATKRFDWSNKVWIPVNITDPPALIVSDKYTFVEEMIEYLDSGCLVCSSNSSDIADLLHKSREYVFNSFFWLEPPLLQ